MTVKRIYEIQSNLTDDIAIWIGEIGNLDGECFLMQCKNKYKDLKLFKIKKGYKPSQIYDLIINWLTLLRKSLLNQNLN